MTPGSSPSSALAGPARPAFRSSSPACLRRTPTAARSSSRSPPSATRSRASRDRRTPRRSRRRARCDRRTDWRATHARRARQPRAAPSRRRPAVGRARCGRSDSAPPRHQPRAAQNRGRARARSSADGSRTTPSRSSLRVRMPSVPISSDSPAVRELARRLDGLPLALELAAARTKPPCPGAAPRANRSAARHAQGRPRRRREALDAASDDRLEPRPPRTRRAGAVRPAGRVSWRLFARSRRAGLRRRHRLTCVAARQEPPSPARRPRRRRPLLDARDDRRVRGGAPEGDGRREPSAPATDRPPPRRWHIEPAWAAWR